MQNSIYLLYYSSIPNRSVLFVCLFVCLLTLAYIIELRNVNMNDVVDIADVTDIPIYTWLFPVMLPFYIKYKTNIYCVFVYA